jgi:hypothetical protein
MGGGGCDRVRDLGETCITSTSAEIQGEGEREGGGGIAPTLRNTSRFHQVRSTGDIRGCGFAGGEQPLIFSHTKHLSENYFAAANHCTQFSLSTRVDGYMRGAGLSEVRKVETTSGVYLRTPRAPASPDAQWAPGTVSAPYAPVMISPPGYPW